MRYEIHNKEILERADIDLNDADNGFFTQSSSHNGTHTEEYFIEMADRLKRTNGVASKVVAVLKGLKESAIAGDFKPK